MIQWSGPSPLLFFAPARPAMRDPRSLRIGFCGNIRSPIINRYFDGMLAYASIHRQLTIVDLRTAAEG